MVTSKDFIDKVVTKFNLDGPSAKRLEAALKRPSGEKFLDFLGTKGITLDAYVNAHGLTSDIVLGDLLTGLSLDRLRGIDVPQELSNRIASYRAAEVSLFAEVEQATEKLATDKGTKQVIEDALAKFSGDMPRVNGKDGIDKWVEGFQKKVDVLRESKASKTQIEMAEHMLGKAKEIGKNLGDNVSRVKSLDGTYKNAQGYEQVLNGLSEEGERLTRTIERYAEHLDINLKGAVREAREAFRAIKDTSGVASEVMSKVKSAMPEGEHLDVEYIAKEVQEAAAKLGSAEGKFTGKFTRAVNALGAEAGKTAEAAKELKGFAKVWSTGMGKAAVIGGGLAALYLASKALGGGNSRPEGATR